jgi:hypothetical protein
MTASIIYRLRVPRLLTVDTPDEHDDVRTHPLAALFPQVVSNSTAVTTVVYPGARFEFIDGDLVRVTKSGRISSRRSDLLRHLARIISRTNHKGIPVKRFVEPGVGRTALIDGLAISGHPEFTDFSVLGIGLTPYSERDFIMKGPDIDGLCSLKKALYRHRIALRLKEIGCRTPRTAAIIDLPGLQKTWPDGTKTAAALLVRAAKSVIRIQQLDPLHGFFHSCLFSEAVREYFRSRSAEVTANRFMNGDPNLELLEACCCHLDIRAIVHQSPEPDLAGSDPKTLAIWLRLREILEYAPVLVQMIKRKVSRELGRDPDEEPLSDLEYVTWFAERMGEQIAAFWKARALYDYRKGRDAKIPSALHESQVSLMAELHDLDTVLFTRSKDLDAVLLTKEQLQRTETLFEELHEVERVEASRIVESLALVVLNGDRAAVRLALLHFEATYQNRTSRRMRGFGTLSRSNFDAQSLARARCGD